MISPFRKHHFVQLSQSRRPWLGRWDGLFRDHEIFVRTGGEVRFVTLQADVQRRAATVVLAVLSLWAMVTLALLGWQAFTRWERQDVISRAVAVAKLESRVERESGRIATQVEQLARRQQYLDAAVKTYLGAEAATPSATAPAARPETSALVDHAALLAQVDAGQRGTAERLVAIAQSRAARAEAALRTLGISPSVAARGGPLLAPSLRAPQGDATLARLEDALTHMAELEELVTALPSNLPAAQMSLSSAFGVRHDPFNGAPTMHAGLDFTGVHGEPIRSAARGVVKFAGQMQGYGNVVEVDHGHGFVTRYAHLSGFTTRPGARVEAGEQIARMGNTGRSTGTHLHFEVRVNGTAVNPGRFLESNRHVLEVKADVQRGRARQPAPAVGATAARAG